MNLLEALGRDPRFADLGGRKQAALEVILRAVDGVMNGDHNYPSNWQRIEDAARVEQGRVSMNIWQEDI